MSWRRRCEESIDGPGSLRRFRCESDLEHISEHMAWTDFEARDGRNVKILAIWPSK